MVSKKHLNQIKRMLKRGTAWDYELDSLPNEAFELYWELAHEQT